MSKKDKINLEDVTDAGWRHLGWMEDKTPSIEEVNRSVYNYHRQKRREKITKIKTFLFSSLKSNININDILFKFD